MAAEYTYTDLQVRVMDTDPETSEAGIAAVTVQNTGDADGVATVRWFVLGGGLAPTEISSSEEQLEVGHSHRVRLTLTGAHLTSAGEDATLAVGSGPEDLAAQAPLA